MTTITAIPDTATASVQLSINYNSPISRVLRNDENGIAEVRTLAGQLPTGASGTLILSDYEAAAGQNTYSAYVDEYATRTNLSINPRATSGPGFATYATGTSEAGTTTYVTGASDGPADGPNGYARRTVTAAKTAGSTGWAATATSYAAPGAGVAGDVATVSFWMRYTGSDPSITVPLRIVFLTGSTTVVTSSDSAPVTFPNGEWVRVSHTATATGTYTHIGWWAYMISGSVLPVGATHDVAGVLTEKLSGVGTYFDGAGTDTTDVDYAWSGTANASASTRTEHIYQVTATAQLVLDAPWLMVPIMPNYALKTQTITGYGSDRQSRSTVHEVIGRADPLVSFGPLGTRTGNLEVWCESLKAARDLETVFTRGETVMLKQNVPGMDMYFVGSSTGIAPYSVQGETTRYALTVDYTEIKRPIGPLAGALGWDFNALAAAYASFDVVTSKFATFDDLTIRNEI